MVEPTAVRQAIARRRQQPPPALLVHPLQIIAAWREIALHGSVTRDSSLDKSDSKALFWEWLIMISEAIGKDVAAVLVPQMTGLASAGAVSLVVTQSYLTSGDSPRVLMARHFELLDRTIQRPEVRDSSSWLDIESDIRREIGCDWRTFMSIGAVLALTGLGSGCYEEKCAWALVDPDVVFAGRVDRATLDPLISQVSCDLAWLRAHFDAAGSIGAIMPDALPLQERPLIRMPSRGYCVSMPQLVAERFTIGVYHTLFNAWRQRTGRPRNRFTTFWGNLLEAYVDSLFEAVYCPSSMLARRLWTDQDLPCTGVKPADIMLDCGATLALFEVTHSHLTRKALVCGDFDQIGKDLARVVVAKAKQLGRAIDDFRKGRFTLRGMRPQSFRRFLPIIVVWQSVPLFAPTIEYVRARLVEEAVLQQPHILPVQVLTISECEGLLAAVHKGEESLLDAITDKVREERTVRESFTNYRHRIGRPLQSGHHPVVECASERLMGQLESSFSRDFDQ